MSGSTRLADRYVDRYGVDVRDLAGSGSAGGLGGAIAALGGDLRSGYELVSSLVGLYRAARGCRSRRHRGRCSGCDLVHRQGRRAASSVTLGARECRSPSSPDAAPGTGRPWPEPAGCTVVSLTQEYGADLARADPLTCVGRAVRGLVDAARPPEHDRFVTGDEPGVDGRPEGSESAYC